MYSEKRTSQINGSTSISSISPQFSSVWWERKMLLFIIHFPTIYPVSCQAITISSVESLSAHQQSKHCSTMIGYQQLDTSSWIIIEWGFGSKVGLTLFDFTSGHLFFLNLYIFDISLASHNKAELYCTEVFVIIGMGKYIICNWKYDKL